MKIFIQMLFLICVLITSSANANLLLNGNFDEADANIKELFYSGYSQSRLLTELGDWDCGIYTCTGDLNDPNLKKDSSTGEPRVKSWGVYEELPSWQTIPDNKAVEVLYSDDAKKNSPIANVAAHSGNLFIELDIHDGTLSYNSAIGQSLDDLIEGMYYELSFFYQPRTLNVGDNGVNLHWFEGNELCTFGLDNIALTVDYTTENWLGSSGVDDGGWKKFSTVKKATSSTMSFALSGFGTVNTYGGLIDTASVVAVPEPNILALMLVGLLGFSFRKKVFHRS